MDPCSKELRAQLEEAIPHLRRWAVRFDSPEYDADLLVSDTVISFLQDPGQYNPASGSLKNFLFSYIKNKAIDFRRGYYRKYRERFRRYLRSGAPKFVSEETPDFDANELKSNIERELQCVSARVAQIFRLFAFDGKGYEEIAQEIGTTVSAVKTAIHRARRQLKSRFQAA